jgi:hypothetical protein
MNEPARKRIDLGTLDEQQKCRVITEQGGPITERLAALVGAGSDEETYVEIASALSDAFHLGMRFALAELVGSLQGAGVDVDLSYADPDAELGA